MDRHAAASYRQREVDVTVSPLHRGSYLVVVVHDPAAGSRDQLLEYIVDAEPFDEAASVGFELARDFIDGQPH